MRWRRKRAPWFRLPLIVATLLVLAAAAVVLSIRKYGVINTVGGALALVVAFVVIVYHFTLLKGD